MVELYLLVNTVCDVIVEASDLKLIPDYDCCAA